MRAFRVFTGEVNPKTGKLIFKDIGVDVCSIENMEPYIFNARCGAETKKILVTRITMKGHGGYYDLVDSPLEVWEKIHERGNDKNPYEKYDAAFRKQSIESDVL